ncbi:MAG: IS1595 family transposase [Bdellovibrionales bacterium]|nr:IS1595 family transposase [Bdellovibrionales bacterium]
MNYQRFKGMSFFKSIKTEEQARLLVWSTRFEGREFVCPNCQSESYWEYACEPEIRKCIACEKHVRLRKGTMFENSKVSMLLWLRAIYFVMSSKRGVSALELQRRLEIGSYRTALGLLKKIRQSLLDRDAQYQLHDSIELDGTTFGSARANNQRDVLVAIETKSWVDSRGREKTRAGFAKVVVADETRANAEKFVSQNIKPGAMVNTDAGKAFTTATVTGIDFDYREMDSKRKSGCVVAVGAPVHFERKILDYRHPPWRSGKISAPLSGRIQLSIQSQTRPGFTLSPRYLRDVSI